MIYSESALFAASSMGWGLKAEVGGQAASNKCQKVTSTLVASIGPAKMDECTFG